MVAAARIAAGCLLIALGVWMVVQAFPVWNVIPPILLGGAGLVLIEWPKLRTRWGNQAQPELSKSAQLLMALSFVGIQVSLGLLIVASIWPGVFGNPGGLFFMPLILIALASSLIYRKLRWGSKPPDGA